MAQQTRSQFARWFAPETLVQSIGIGLALTVISRFTALGRGVLFARLMDRAELGTWAITNNTMQMLSIVLVFGIPAGLCRYVARYERDGRLLSFLGYSLGVPFLLGLAVCVAGVVFSRPLARLVYEDETQTQLVVLLVVGALVMLVLNLLQGALQGLRVNRMNAIMLVVQSVGFASLAGMLFVAWRPSALAGAWAFLIASAAVTAVPVWMIWRHLRCETAPASASESAAASTGMWWPLLVYSLGSWGTSSLFSLWGVLDRYMLLHFDTLSKNECLSELGTYHIVENVTLPIQALGAGLAIQVLAHVVHLWESNDRAGANRLVQLATKLIVFVFTFAAAGLVVLKQFVLVGIFGDESLASGEILEPVLVTVVLLTAQCMVRSHLLCRERVWGQAAAWVAALGVSFGLNLILIPTLHLKGASITALVSTATSTVLVMWLTERSGLKLDRSTWATVALPLVLLLPSTAMLA